MKDTRQIKRVACGPTLTPEVGFICLLFILFEAMA